MNRPFQKIAEDMANDLLHHGNDERGTCHRIQFKIGGYGQEVSGGGLGRPGLALHLERAMDKYRPQITSIVEGEETKVVKEMFRRAHEVRAELDAIREAGSQRLVAKYSERSMIHEGS